MGSWAWGSQNPDWEGWDDPNKYQEERYQPVGATKESLSTLQNFSYNDLTDDQAVSALKNIAVSQAQEAAATSGEAAATSGDGGGVGDE